ncbi:Para-aminobenzoate synthase component 1 [Piscirickettsia salmonis]|uniref:aminodeoxychorismate synthase component I n=1 Tax=Piscirickettsia salmonis TaxID=1238 RepID=UPI0012B6B274|nr:aminodeoxychorismate synthase component I [Piscirickettsia salmonis]QGO23066.1 Para-aminobenzoate synthase component 1 [Piscirickettsia salmonis]
MLMIKPLSYTQDSAYWFSKIAHLDWPIWLDSCAPLSSGRFDILAANPYKKIINHHNQTYSTDATGNQIQVTTLDPFSFIKEHIQQVNTHITIPENYHLPFCGGALGYFGYDLGRILETLPEHAEHELDLPDLAVGLYDWAIIIDHQNQSAYWVSPLQQKANSLDIYQQLSKSPIHDTTTNDNIKTAIPGHFTDFKLTRQFNSNLSFNDYKERFNKIQDYIHAGDCYQVNLTQRFVAPFTGHPLHAYLQLRQHNPAPFACYMDIGDNQILSCSPERFLKINHNIVETKPIKGTVPRGKTAAEDASYQEKLLNSEKDRAENIMIVDLMRNDLGRSCEIGSVITPKVCELESFKNVHHLVSTVRGTLAKQTHATDVLKLAFPGGSITGAPKIRAMEIIEELEPHRRSLHYGSIGYISYDGHMDTNITIRTLICHQNHAYCWAGGGIVADSQLEQEYQETFDKVTIIHETLYELSGLSP